MTDEQAIGAVIDEMYGMISGPAGPRDWYRQANCFLPEARQVRTFIDDEGRPAMTAMGLAEYAANTTPFFMANPFYRWRPAAGSTCSATSPMCGAPTKPALRPTTRRPNAAASTRSSCSGTPSSAGGSST